MMHFCKTKIVLMGTGVIKKGYVVFPFFNSAPVTYKIYTELNTANDQWATKKKTCDIPLHPGWFIGILVTCIWNNPHG